MNDALFSALAHPARRQILALLRSQDQSAGALAEAFDISRSSVSEHLGILRRTGLVFETKAGRRRIYSLNAEPMQELANWLMPYKIYWQKQLGTLASTLEEKDK